MLSRTLDLARIWRSPRRTIASALVLLLGGCSVLYPPSVRQFDVEASPGFVLEKVYQVPRDQQGSWISLAVESNRTLVAGSENGKLYRIILPQTADEPVAVEELAIDIGTAHGLLHAFDSLYVVINSGVLSPSEQNGLYRLRDEDGDRSYESIEKLRSLEGFGEHGPHQLVVGPAGESLYFVAGNGTPLTELTSSRIAAPSAEDQLLPVLPSWDPIDYDPPGGWIARMDPNGHEWELIAAGMRNPYDLAFNRDGELFVFDADMEWDIGTPWYRPTRVLHIVSGGEYGWRRGSAKWPAWFPDSLPAVVNVGTASPTGIAFGYDTNFPGNYRNALFLGDWSHGRIYAVHLATEGASYRATKEVLASGHPMPVTDLVAHPGDGALYITTGGRGIRSILYRLRHEGPAASPLTNAEPTLPEFQLRRSLEELHQGNSATNESLVWSNLGHSDRHIRFAARIALEHRPADSWSQRGLSQKEPAARIAAAIALARTGGPPYRDPALRALVELSPQTLPLDQRRDWLRAVHLLLARHGRPEPVIESELEHTVDLLYPSDDFSANQLAGEVLAFLDSPSVVPKTLDLLEEAATQEQQVHFAKVLSYVSTGWSEKDRIRYLSWLDRADTLRGGNSFAASVDAIEEQALANIPRRQRKNLRRRASDTPPHQAVGDIIPAGPGRRWTTAEAHAAIKLPLSHRDFERGRAMFAATSCWSCHRFANQGGSLGPDLSTAGSRFSPEELLEAIIEPNRFVSDQYASSEVRLTDGTTVHGQIFNTVPGVIPVYGGALEIRTDLGSGEIVRVRAGQVDDIRKSARSMMPAGLVDDLNAEELSDLVAFVLSAGDPNHPSFR